MIEIPTVFILGAGASKPYGYPTAAELREFIIINFCNEYRSLLEKASVDAQTITRFLHDAQIFVDAFNDSSIESIDQFLSINPSFTSIGKKVITLSILYKEKMSALNEGMGLSNASKSWYRLLFKHMTSGLKEPSDFVKFPENKVAFITFN
jgi:hypothetical protein